MALLTPHAAISRHFVEKSALKILSLSDKTVAVGLNTKTTNEGVRIFVVSSDAQVEMNPVGKLEFESADGRQDGFVTASIVEGTVAKTVLQQDDLGDN